MKSNMGMLDRSLRVLIAIAIIIFYFTAGTASIFFWVLLGVAGIFLLTSAVSFCPLYAIIGIRTCKKV